MAKKKNSNYVTEKTKQKMQEKEKAKKAQRIKKIATPIVISVVAGPA